MCVIDSGRKRQTENQFTHPVPKLHGVLMTGWHLLDHPTNLSGCHAVISVGVSGWYWMYHTYFIYSCWPYLGAHGLRLHGYANKHVSIDATHAERAGTRCDSAGCVEMPRPWSDLQGKARLRTRALLPVTQCSSHIGVQVP